MDSSHASYDAKVFKQIVQPVDASQDLMPGLWADRSSKQFPERRTTVVETAKRAIAMIIVSNKGVLLATT